MVSCQRLKSDMKKYTYKEFKIGIFRFVLCLFGKKYTIRFEISSGWDN